MNITFLIGSPRSGTTILGEVLGLHPDVAYWYEPTFVFDKYFKSAPHDRRIADDLNPEIAAYIRGEFEYFYRKNGKRVIVEKSPRHSLKLPFLMALFPDAKFLHLIRHGGDTTLSIFREWQSREAAGRRLLSWRAFDKLRKHVLFQPLLRHRIAALRFQFDGNLVSSQNHLYRSRWNGRFGWGPRFEGWEQVIDDVSLLEFNAMQWASCVDTVLDDQRLIDPERFVEVRYEDFITDPETALRGITDFIGLPFPAEFMETIPPIMSGNKGKWRKALSPEDQRAVTAVIEPTLNRLGYDLNNS